jgi:hypothetical protein
VYDAFAEGLVMRIGMRFLGLISTVACVAACSAEGMMAETDGETDTDTDTDALSDSLTSASMTTSPSTTAGSTMSGTTSPTTTMTVTTDEPTTGTTMEPPTTTMTGEETGCPPGTANCPCDVGSECEGDLLCVEGTCVEEPPCDEPDEEPNDSFEEAIEIGAIECSMEYDTVEGALAGTDADFYSFSQEGICFDPGPQALVEAEEDVRVCVYMQCEGEDQGSVNCGQQEDDTYDDLSGCCGTNEAHLDNPGCPGIPLPRVPTGYFIRVISADESACITYTLSYRIE